MVRPDIRRDIQLSVPIVARLAGSLQTQAPRYDLGDFRTGVEALKCSFVYVPVVVYRFIAFSWSPARTHR